MKRKTTRFALKLGIYVLPFAIAFAALTGAMIYVGESMPLGWVIAHQQADDSVLYRPRYGNRDVQFKIAAVNANQPDIMALGSSRILQWRRGFFTQKPDAFYNAAIPAAKLPQVQQILTGINPAALPDVIILAIDPPWFHPDYEGTTFPAPTSDFETVFMVNRSVVQDVLAGEPFTREGFDRRAYVQRFEPSEGGLALGMRAIRDGQGFRSDGSEQFGDFTVAQWLWQPFMRDNHLEDMRTGDDLYRYGDTIDEAKYATLIEILDYAAAHDITVIGYLAAYMPSLWQEMVERGNHDYMLQLAERLPQTFAQYGYAFHDFSSGAWFNSPDDEFFDGWHTSERGDLRIFLRLLQRHPDILGDYADAHTIQHIIQTAPDHWDIFGMDGVWPNP